MNVLGCLNDVVYFSSVVKSVGVSVEEKTKNGTERKK